MKNSRLAILFSLPFLAFGSGVAIIQGTHHNVFEIAASNYSKTTLPTTIDLNPVSEESIRSYYSALDGKNYSGNDLLIHLKDILKEGQQHFSYDQNNGVEIWKAYEITDRDWTLSPASSITAGNYDPSTNIITNYVYGNSVSDPGVNNPYVHCLYRLDSDESGRIKAWDVHGISNGVNGFDREHVWPKSRGFDDAETGTYGARGDLHHLMAGDHYVNSSLHNNIPYAFVDLSKTHKDAGEKYSYDVGNYTGTALNVTTTQTVFEPADEDKGDIARACFYMVARYNNLSGLDDTIDSGNPNLTLDDSTVKETETSTATKAVSLGVLRDLLAWHRLDPVDEYEKTRNDILYRNFSKNRNPFIDYPSWVDAIWGSVELGENNRSISAYTATPVGVAAPSTDVIYGSLTPAVTSPIISIRVENPKTSFEVGDSFNFGGRVIGKAEDGSERNVTSECSFSGYDLTKEGSSTVTVTHKPSGKTASYSITVAEKANPLKSLPLPVLIGAGAAAVLILILIIIFLAKGSKKQKKAAAKVLKKAVTGSSKSSSSSKKSSSNKKKTSSKK